MKVFHNIEEEEILDLENKRFRHPYATLLVSFSFPKYLIPHLYLLFLLLLTSNYLPTIDNQNETKFRCERVSLSTLHTLCILSHRNSVSSLLIIVDNSFPKFKAEMEKEQSEAAEEAKQARREYEQAGTLHGKLNSQFKDLDYSLKRGNEYLERLKAQKANALARYSCSFFFFLKKSYL